MGLRAEIDWKLIDRAAESLGVGPHARKFWKRTRHVPHKWRFPIIEKTGGAVSMHDFDAEKNEAQK